MASEQKVSGPKLAAAKDADPKIVGAPIGSVPKEEVKMRKGRKPIPTDESKEQRFYRLANKRVNRALAAIKVVGNLANKSIYSYTEMQAQLICSTLVKAVDMVRNDFTKRDATKNGFSL